MLGHEFGNVDIPKQIRRGNIRAQATFG